MLRYKCYICNKQVDIISHFNDGSCLGDSITVPDANGRNIEYQVCERCREKFLKQLAKVKREIFQEMIDNV